MTASSIADERLVDLEFSMLLYQLAGAHRNPATRAACSVSTRALSFFDVPARSPRTVTVGLDQTGTRGQPPQVSL